MPEYDQSYGVYCQSDVFGIEKKKGKVEGILEAVYQNVFGQELYPTMEEKAANLLYFMIKDHPFADGCKRMRHLCFRSFWKEIEFCIRMVINGSVTVHLSQLH